MISRIQIFIIKFITPIVWKLNPHRKIQALRNFSNVEKDSACRFMQYVSLIDDVEIKKEVFQHAMEEFYHASLFEDLVKKLNNSYANVEVTPRKFLITEKSSLDEVIDAYAYAHVGEAAINKNFYAYSSKRIEKIVRRVFLKISIDEKRHASSSDEVLMKFCNNDMAKYKKKYNKAKYQRLYEEYSILMKKVGETQLNLILRLIYMAVGPFVFFTLKNRLAFSNEEQLKVFKEQIKDLERLEK